MQALLLLTELLKNLFFCMYTVQGSYVPNFVKIGP